MAGALALSGWPIATFVSIRADPDVDESFYFLQASGLLLWLFAAPVLAVDRAPVPGPRRPPGGGDVFAPTAEFVVRKAPQEPLVVPAPAVRAMAALREASCPGDVVLSRARADLVPLPVVLAGRRVALADYIGYWRQFTTLEALEARRERVRAFFRARQQEEALGGGPRAGGAVRPPARPRDGARRVGRRPGVALPRGAGACLPDPGAGADRGLPLGSSRPLSVSPAFILFVLLALVAPGAGLQRWARVRVDPALVLPLGAVLAAFAYWLSLASGLAWLFPLALAAAALGLVVRRPGAMDPPVPRSLWPAAAALVALLAATQYSLNRPAADGTFLLDPMGDQPLHAGIAWELTLPYPPQVPGLAGVPLSYHIGADLVRAAALRWAGVHPYAPLNREEPTLWALALMLALGGLVHRLGGSRLAVALAPWTIILTDFSFLCAALPDTRWWSDVFRANLLISLAFTNPVVPALALALGCLIALARYESGEGRPWLAFALIQAAAVPWFKVFLGAQLALSLALAALLTAWSRRRGAESGACRRGAGPGGDSPRRERRRPGHCSRCSGAGRGSRSRWCSPPCAW